jgi:hypothetical protein
MASRHAVSAAILVAAMTLGVSGCGGDDDPGNDPSALPTPTTSTPTSATTAPTESTSPTTNAEAWRAKFTKEQLTAYDRALAAWKQFEELQERYQRKPVDRETVLSFYERYTHNANALTDSYEANFINGGVRIPSQPTPLTWTGRKIELNAQGGLVEFDQCTDYTTLDIRRNGEPVANAAPTKNDSAIVRVQMDADAEGTWRLFTSKVVDKPCA